MEDRDYDGYIGFAILALPMFALMVGTIWYHLNEYHKHDPKPEDERLPELIITPITPEEEPPANCLPPPEEDDDRPIEITPVSPFDKWV